MNIFVSSQAVDAQQVRIFLRALADAGHAIDHSPRNPEHGDDERWQLWYRQGLPTAVTWADRFVIVIDSVWESSSWMAAEADLAARSGLPVHFWNPDGHQVTAKLMLSYLQNELPDAIDAALNELSRPSDGEKYRLIYRNKDWLYSVYRSQTGSHVLVAVVPGVGWQDIARSITAAERAMLDDDPGAFTELALSFVRAKDSPEIRHLRIESRIVNIDTDTILLATEIEQHNG